MANSDDTPANRLRRARETAKGGMFKYAVDAARFFHWDDNTYKSHENGIRNFPPDKAVQYARAFNVTAGWLLFGEGNNSLSQPNHKGPTVAALVLPMLRWSSFEGGMSIPEAIKKAEKYIEIPALVNLGPLAFVLDADDDSMVPFPPAPGDNFPFGTTLVFDPGIPVKPGDYVLVKVSGQAASVFRKYRETGSGNQVEFVPLNANYRTLAGTLNETAFIIARLATDLRRY